MMHIRLPGSATITLWEAVTAFVDGQSRAVSSEKFYPCHKSNALLDRLHEAAHAGRVRFHALGFVENKYQEIDPAYFGRRYILDWNKNELRSWHPIDETEWDKPVYDGQEYNERVVLDWCDVHVDREQFASLLKDMGVSVQQNLDSGVLQNLDAEAPADLSDLETIGTGFAGRPQKVAPYVLSMAKERLDAGDYPDTKTEFAKQLIRAFAKAAPRAAHLPKPKTLSQNAAFSEMWRRKPRKKPS